MSRNYELMQQTGTLNPPPTAQRTIYCGDSEGKRKNGNPNGNTTPFRLHDLAARDESFKLIQNIFLLHVESSPRVVVFAGIDSGNGCSAICAQAAKTLASRKLGTVCLVDANLRAPALPDYFGVGNHFGLTEALSQKGAVRDFTKVIGPDNLSLLSCGSLGAESPYLLNSDTMKARITELRNEFTYVLIDSPPLNAYSDGVTLGQLADGLVVVLEANATRREAACKVTENLRVAQIKILGAVLNKRTYPIPQALYKLL